MNLRDIEYILKAYETGRFAEASKQCHISQPSLSIQIKKIERELGHPIFVRQRNGVKLTAFGQNILPHFEEIQKRVGLIHNESRTYKGNKSQTIRLGAIYTVAPFLFPQLRTIPGIRFEESYTQELLGKLLNDKLDAAILALPIRMPNFSTKKLLKEPFYLVSSKKNKLTKKIDLALMSFPEDCQFIALTEEHCLGDQVKDLCLLFGHQRKRIIEQSSLETIRRLIASGDFFTILPEMAKVKGDGLKYQKLPEKYYREVGLVYKKNSPLEEDILSLYESIKNHL